MKKVILCAMALSFGAVAFAQVSNAAGTAPTASTPVANLSADPTANVGQAVQNGDDQKVRIRQAGTEQSVYTEQDNGTAGGRNLAYVRQTGAVSGVSGYANRAETRQSGEDNQSTTLQEGDLNNASVGQGQNDPSSARNKARIRQGTGQQSESNYAAIEQDGNDNLASTLQTWDNSDAWTRQVGNDNKSMVSQNGAPEDSDGHEAMVYQEGDSNESAVMQEGDGGRNRAVAVQYGDNNKAKQSQNTTAGVGETGNTALALQGSTVAAGVSVADITFFNDITTDIINTVDDRPAGDTGTGFESFGGIVFQNQGGEDNTAGAAQFGAGSEGSNYIKQNQAYGSGNKAHAIQNRNGGAGGNNEVEQYQGGDDNTAGIRQYGVGHQSLQTQIGDGNSSLTSQRGEENLSNTHQRGNDNAVTTAQRGIDNRSLVVQYDGQSFVAQQNLDGLGGGGNQIDALQLGPDGNFEHDAIDCYFNPQMDPTMDYSVPSLEIDDICPDC